MFYVAFMTPATVEGTKRTAPVSVKNSQGHQNGTTDYDETALKCVV
jgi:hypothetical protein